MIKYIQKEGSAYEADAKSILFAALILLLFISF